MAPEQRLEYADHNKTQHQHVERGDAAMHEYLVDHYLKEKRRDQAEQLQEKRSQQNLTQQALVFDHRGNEPRDIEVAHAFQRTGAAGEQDQIAAPDIDKFIEINRYRTGQHRIVQQNLVFFPADLRENNGCAVLAQRDSG